MSGSSEVQLDRIMSLLFERDQLAFFLSNAIQRLSEIEQKLHSVKIEKRSPVVTVGLQALEIRILKADKAILKNFLAYQDAGCDTSRRRQRSDDVVPGLNLQYVGEASRVLKSVPVWYPRERSELCPFNSVQKRRWSRRGENVFVNGFIILSGAMIALFLSDSTVRNGKHYRPPFLYESDFLKDMVVQEMTAIEWSEIFSTTEE